MSALGRGIKGVDIKVGHDEPWFCCLRRGTCTKRIDHGRGNDDDQFDHGMIEVLGAEELAKDGNISDAWNFAENLRGAMVEQAGDDKALSILDLDLSLGASRGERGHGESGDGYGVGVVESADLGGELEPNRAVGIDGRRKADFDSIGTKLNADGGRCPNATLDHRERKLSAGEEACGNAAHGGERGFGEHLEDLLLLKVLDGGAYIELGVVEQYIEGIADGEGGTGAGDAARILLRRSTYGGPSSGKDVDPILIEAWAVDVDYSNRELPLLIVNSQDLRGADED